jgi:tricorn protease
MITIIKTPPGYIRFYSGYSPVFDPEGKYLYLLTSQSFQPIYSSIDNSFIYANSAQVAAIALLKTTPSC